MPSSSKTKSKCVKAAGNVSGRLSEFDGRDGPLPFVASDGDSQAMHLVEPNAFNRTGLAVGKDHGLADKRSLGLLELAEDRARAFLHGWHDGCSRNRENGIRRCLVFETCGSRDQRAAKICRWQWVPRDLEIVGGG
jgi:hypothetical protein